MGPDLATLIRQPTFALRLVAGVETGDAAVRMPLAWAHSSDLQDPTPWLSPGGLLLTDGLQFDPVGEASWAEGYVDRLQSAGVRALGFATGIVHDAIPDRLLRACDNHRLPLVEVGRDTPFMAVIRFVADARARAERERLEWSLAAQRGVALAALRPDGLAAVLRELEQRLSCWVALFDAGGERIEVETRLALPPALRDDVQRAVRDVLGRGSRAGLRLSVEAGDVTLQTIGQSRRLTGVLAVGTPTPLDHAGHDLVNSVIALASIALDQSRTIDEARRRLRSGLLELMLAGELDTAARTVEELWGRLPGGPVHVVVVPDVAPVSGLPTELELYGQRRRGRLFFAEHRDALVVVTSEDDLAALQAILGRHAAPAGCSTAIEWPELAAGLTEARRAAARTFAGRPFVRFAELVEEGLFGLLEASGGAVVASRLLQPLRARPAAEARTLLLTARTWLEANGAWDPAAKQLGVHRHTLRNRIDALAGVLGIDLDRFGDRAELWAALQLVDVEGFGV